MRLVNWFRGALGDLVFLSLLIWLLWKVRGLAVAQPPNVTGWLLVYLTAIYALLTLYLALVAIKSALATERSALAAERSAAAMEASINEARLVRIAQFGAVFRFADPQRCFRSPDSSLAFRVLNPFGQPIVDITAYLWLIERGPKGEPEVRYSSMMESEPRTVLAAETQVDITLRPSGRPESECRQLGELALQRYQEVFFKLPENTLCLITYQDRANIALSPSMLVWDFQIVDKPSTPFDDAFRERVLKGVIEGLRGGGHKESKEDDDV